MIFLRLSLLSVINNECFISSAVVCDLLVFKKKEMNSIAKDIFLEGMEKKNLFIKKHNFLPNKGVAIGICQYKDLIMFVFIYYFPGIMIFGYCFIKSETEYYII